MDPRSARGCRRAGPVRRVRTRPSTDADARMPRPLTSVAYSSSRPLGAKLGDSSRAVSVTGDLLSAGEIEHHHLEATAATPDIGEQPAVGRQSRTDVVVTVERDALRRTAARRHAVDLRAAAAVRGEVDRLAVRAEHRLGIDAARLRQAPHVRAVGVHQEDLRVAFARQRHGQRSAVRRPGGRAVRAAESSPRPCARPSSPCARRRPACRFRTTRRQAACRRATTPAR